MAKWWELAIPTAGTLLGAGIGSTSQLLLRRRQDRHETRMRLMDEKLRTYGRIAFVFNEARDVVTRAERAVAVADAYDGMDLADLSGEKRKSAKEAFLAAAEASGEAAEITREVTELLQRVQIIAPKRIRETAKLLSDATLAKDSALMAQYSGELIALINRDIGVE